RAAQPRRASARLRRRGAGRAVTGADPARRRADRPLHRGQEGGAGRVGAAVPDRSPRAFPGQGRAGGAGRRRRSRLPLPLAAPAGYKARRMIAVLVALLAGAPASPQALAGSWRMACADNEGMVVEFTVDNGKASGKVVEPGKAAKYGYKKGEEMFH